MKQSSDDDQNIVNSVERWVQEADAAAKATETLASQADEDLVRTACAPNVDAAQLLEASLRAETTHSLADVARSAANVARDTAMLARHYQRLNDRKRLVEAAVKIADRREMAVGVQNRAQGSTPLERPPDRE